jgi:hypothetical protein
MSFGLSHVDTGGLPRVNSSPVAADRIHGTLAIVAGGIQLVMGLLVAASGLLAPLWAVGVLAVVWIALSAQAIRIWRRHRFSALIPAASMVVFWVAFLRLGELLLDGFGA